MRALFAVALLAACNSADQTPDRAACGGACPTGQFCGADDVCHLDPPDTTIVTTPPPVGNQATASFTFDATRPGATFTCRVDDREPVPCTSPHEVTVDEGTHVFEVVAQVDGLPDQTAARHEWRVDLTPPDTTIDGPRLTNLPTVELALAALEERARLECSVDGGTEWSSCPAGNQFGPHEDGTYTVLARGVDEAGNPDATPATWTWTVDRTAPEVSIDRGPSVLTNSTVATFEFSSSEPEGAVFFCQLDEGVEVACASGITYDPLAATAHTFRVRATDAATNPSKVKSWAWTIDTSSPDTIVDARPAALTRLTATRIDFHASVASATFRCRLDAQPETDCTSPREFAVGEGDHVFVVTARSAAGVPDVDPARVEWTVDLTPPATVAIDSPNTATIPSNDTTPTLGGSTDPDTQVTLHRSGDCAGTGVPGRSNAAGRFSVDVGATLPAAANGNTTYTAEAVDAVGNPRCSAPFVYRTDTAGPSVARTTPDLSVPYPTRRPTFGGTAEIGAKVRVFRGPGCTGNSTAQVNAVGGVWSITLDTGTEAALNTSTTYSAQAVDAAGNDTCTPDFVYVHDNLDPTVARTTPDLTVPHQQARPTFGGTAEAGAKVRVFRGPGCTGNSTAQVNAVGGAWSITLDAGTEAALNTSTTYSAQAVDAAGNDACTADFVYVHDNLDPAVARTTPDLSIPSSTRRPTFGGTAEAGAQVRVFRGPGCTGNSTAQVNAVGGAWSVTLDAGTEAALNTSTTYSAQAVDAAGNDACTPDFVYVHDNLDPAVARTTPDLSVPSQQRRPTFGGTAELGAKVRVYRGSACSGAPTAQVTANSGVWSITLDAATEAAANTSTTYSAQAVDAAGNDACTPDFVYVHDDLDPAVARTTPDLSQPYRERRPTFGGTAELGAKVRVFRGAACTGPSTTQVTAAAGTWSITLDATTEAPLTDSTTYSAQAVDAAGNDACTADFVYVTDNAPPPVNITLPVLTQTYREVFPTFMGTSESGAKVRVWRGTGCTAGNPSTPEIAAGPNGFSITVGIATQASANGDTVYWVQAKDALDNTVCHGPLTYHTDNAGPTLQFDVPPPSIVVGTQLNVSRSVSPTDPGVVYLSMAEPGTVTCSVDGGASQNLPLDGTISFNGLPFGARDLECIGYDALSNPSAPLRATIGMASERGGHVVLVGHDFSVAESPAAAQRLLGNAVLLANPTDTATISVLTVDVTATDAEANNTRGVITKVTQDAGRPATYKPMDIESPLGPQLDGIQVLVIYDQNDQTFGTAFYAAHKNALDEFRALGGVIVVLDGIDANAKPSETFRLLALMGLMPSATFAKRVPEATINVNSLNVDPVAQGAAGQYAPPLNSVSFTPPNSNGFGATTVARGNASAGQPVVLHWHQIPSPWAQPFDAWPASGWTELFAESDNPVSQPNVAFGVGNGLTGPATFSSWWRYGGATLPAFYGRHTRLWIAVGQGDVELGFGADGGGVFSLALYMNVAGTADLNFVMYDRVAYGDVIGISDPGPTITRLPVGAWIQADVYVDPAGIATATLSTLEGRILGQVSTRTPIVAGGRTGWALRTTGAVTVDFLHAFR